MGMGEALRSAYNKRRKPAMQKRSLMPMINQLGDTIAQRKKKKPAVAVAVRSTPKPASSGDQQRHHVIVKKPAWRASWAQGK